jgi:DNA topoisomerase-1
MAKKSKEQQVEELAIEQEDIPTRATVKKIFRNEKQKADEERRDFVPLTNPKQTVEVKAKPRLTREQIEIIEKPRQSEREDKQKIKLGRTIEKEEKIKITKPKRTVVEKVKTPKIETLRGNSILIITEKPQAAAKIASALSNGKDSKHSDNGIPYYEFEKNGENIIVACAVGHLFSLSQDVKGSDYPIFDISWKPNFEVRKKDFTKKYYNNLLKLVKRAREIIVATDYDIEGEVIGYNVVRFIAHQKDAKRMKYSSLTKDELEEAFKNVHPTIDWGQAIAGETRHYTDWFYGINLSRALMSSIKSMGKFRIMSIGRVQGPALKLIVDKEKEIQAFKPQKYWKIFIDVQEKIDKTNNVTLRHIKDIFNEKELEKFKELNKKEVEVITEKHSQTIQPPTPFDLTTLQTEAYKFHYISPARTLAIAQQLYLAGLISYPRTSSQKIPDAINPKAILKRIQKYYSEVKLATRDKPTEGKKSDPAHPSIYPTGEYQNLEGEEKKIYELVVRRFIACFCEAATVENKTITATAQVKNKEGKEEKLLFKEKGLEIVEKAWMEVYETKLQEKELRDFNGPGIITKLDIQQDETKPPKRFSPASIVSELEKRGLGTKATRANIIETLYDRGYIMDNKSIKATPLGINLINTLLKYSPIIIDENLTKTMEKGMEEIALSKKDLDTKQHTLLDKAKSSLVEISKDFKEKEKKIGQELIAAEQESWKQENLQNELTLCPVCQKGKLTIKYSPKNRKHFVACNAYPDCKTTFSLPPYGVIKKLDNNKLCDKCNFPLLMSLRKGKRPWIFCFNPQCPSRQNKETIIAPDDSETPEQSNSQEETSEEQ